MLKDSDRQASSPEAAVEAKKHPRMSWKTRFLLLGAFVGTAALGTSCDAIAERQNERIRAWGGDPELLAQYMYLEGLNSEDEVRSAMDSVQRSQQALFEANRPTPEPEPTITINRPSPEDMQAQNLSEVTEVAKGVVGYKVKPGEGLDMIIIKLQRGLFGGSTSQFVEYPTPVIACFDNFNGEYVVFSDLGDGLGGFQIWEGDELLAAANAEALTDHLQQAGSSYRVE